MCFLAQSTVGESLLVAWMSSGVSRRQAPTSGGSTEAGPDDPGAAGRAGGERQQQEGEGESAEHAEEPQDVGGRVRNRVPAARPVGSGRSAAYRRGMPRLDRKRAYFVLMGTCLALIVLAWNVVRFWSTTAAVVMSVVAAVIPPVAVVVANFGALRQSEPPTGRLARRQPGLSSAARVPPRSYAASRRSSVTSPSTSSTSADCRQPSAPTIDSTERTAPAVS